MELPPEAGRPGYCAKLLRSLYGTRDAPRQWEAYLAAQLSALGFRRGRSNACAFYHPKLQVRCIVHGDDFAMTGTERDLQQIQAAMEKVFLLKRVGCLGIGPGDQQELRVLNRVLRLTPMGSRVRLIPATPSS